MGFWDSLSQGANSLYDSTVGKAVDTAKNLWTAGTTPTAGNMYDAMNQAATIYTGLATPETKAATEAQVAKLKAPATQQSALDQIATTQKSLEEKIKYLWEAGTTPVGDKGSIVGAFLKAYSPEVMEGYKAIPTKVSEAGGVPGITKSMESEMQAKQDAAKASALKIYMDEYQRQMDGAKKIGGIGAQIVIRAGHQFITGLTGQEPGDISTGNKVADIISSLIGQGAGMIVGAELTGGAALGARAAQLIPKIKGVGTLERVANAIVKGAVHGGVESELLSGVHSVLNADTAEKARERAKEYGLMGLVGGGAGGAGAELLGMMARKLKSVVPDHAVVEHIKDYVPDLEIKGKLPESKAAQEIIERARKIIDNFDEQRPEVVYEVKNILNDIIEHQNSLPASLVKDAKTRLLDLHDIAEHRHNIEMAQEIVPSKGGLARRELKPSEVPANATVELTGMKGEKILAKVEAIPGKLDEFFYQEVSKSGKPKGEKIWAKTDYWKIEEVTVAAPKLKAAEAKAPKGVYKELDLPKVPDGTIVQLTDKAGKTFDARVRSVPKNPDQFFYQMVDKYGKPTTPNRMETAYYWTAKEAAPRLPKPEVGVVKKKEVPVKPPAEVPVKAPVKAPAEAPVKAPAPEKVVPEVPKMKAPAKAEVVPTEVPKTKVPVKAPAKVPVKAAAIPPKGKPAKLTTQSIERPVPKTERMLQPEQQKELFPEVAPLVREAIPKQELKKVSKLEAWKEKVYQHMVDEARPIEKLAEKTGGKEYTLAANLKMSSSITKYLFDRGLVDKKGSLLGKSLREIVEGKLPQEEGALKAFWESFLVKHMPITEQNVGVLAKFEKEMPAEFKGVADDLANWIDTFAKKWGKTPDDIYRQLVEITPMDKVANPLEVLVKVIDRAVRTEKYNDVLVELVNSVRKVPKEVEAAIRDVTGTDTTYMQNLLKVKMPNGGIAELLVKDNILYTSLTDLIKVVGEPGILQKMVQILKNVLTVKNPLFAIRNVVKDIPSALIKTKDAPKLLGEMWKRKGVAARDMLEALHTGKSTAEHNLYEAVGGGGGMFVRAEAGETAGKLAGTVKTKYTIWTPFKGGLGRRATALNDVVESIPRIAEFNRVFKETGDIDKALFAANDVTVNFSRGGKWAKDIDKFVPYFNAGMQGLDNFLRSFGPSRLVSTLIKGGAIITAPKVVQLLINHSNPNYQKLEHSIKDNFFIIPLGNPRTTERFIKVPASREFNVLFGALFQRALGEGFKGIKEFATLKGQKDFFKEQMGTPFKSGVLLPPNLLAGNILGGAMGALANWDFYFGNPIIGLSMTMGNVPKHLQFDEKTNKLLVALSQMVHDKAGVDWSPMMIQYLIKEYTGELGQIALEGFSGLTGAAQKASKGDIAAAISELGKGLGDMAGVEIKKWSTDTLNYAQSITDFYDLREKVGQEYAEAKIAKATNLSELKAMASALDKASTQMSNIRKEVKNLKQGDPKVRELQRQIVALSETMMNQYGKAEIAPIGGVTPESGGRVTTPTKTGGGGGGAAKKTTATAKAKTTATPKLKAAPKAAPKTTYPTPSGGATGGGGSVLSQYTQQ